MLQSTLQLCPFTNCVTGFRPFANGLTFLTACTRPKPFVTRLDAEDRFRLCVDFTSRSIMQTTYRPYVCKSPEIFYRFAATSRAQGAERGSRNTK